MLLDLLRKARMMSGVNSVETISQDCRSLAGAAQPAPMCGSVDALGEPANNGQASLREFPGKPFCIRTPLGSGLPAADDGHPRPAQQLSREGLTARPKQPGNRWMRLLKGRGKIRIRIKNREKRVVGFGVHGGLVFATHYRVKGTREIVRPY